MFLLYINDITTNISSSIRLFADDCVLYRVIRTEEHCLQQDLDCIIQWTKQWQINLNIDKCAILICSRSISPPKFQYYVDNATLNRTNQSTFISWSLIPFNVILYTYKLNNKPCKKITKLCQTKFKQLY